MFRACASHRLVSLQLKPPPASASFPVVLQIVRQCCSNSSASAARYLFHLVARESVDLLVWQLVHVDVSVACYCSALAYGGRYPLKTGKRNSIISRKSDPATASTWQAFHPHRRKPSVSVSVACYPSAIGARRPSSLKQASATASSAVSPIQHPHQPGRPFIHIAVSPSASVYVSCIVRDRPSLPTWQQLFDFVPTPVSPPQYVPTFMHFIRLFLFHHHSPHHPSIVNSSHHPAPAP